MRPSVGRVHAKGLTGHTTWWVPISLDFVVFQLLDGSCPGFHLHATVEVTEEAQRLETCL